MTIVSDYLLASTLHKRADNCPAGQIETLSGEVIKLSGPFRHQLLTLWTSRQLLTLWTSRQLLTLRTTAAP